MQHFSKRYDSNPKRQQVEPGKLLELHSHWGRLYELRRGRDDPRKKSYLIYHATRSGRCDGKS
jgi:hypothetical protein